MYEALQLGASLLLGDAMLSREAARGAMVSGRAPEIWIGEDGEALAREGVRRFVDVARRSIAARGRFVVGTGWRQHAATSVSAFVARRFDRLGVASMSAFPTNGWWPLTVRTATSRWRTTAFGVVSIPPGQIHAIPTAMSVDEAALRYDQTLREILPKNEPRLDLALLGMGADGHTASIFPDRGCWPV